MFVGFDCHVSACMGRNFGMGNGQDGFVYIGDVLFCSGGGRYVWLSSLLVLSVIFDEYSLSSMQSSYVSIVFGF